VDPTPRFFSSPPTVLVPIDPPRLGAAVSYPEPPGSFEELLRIAQDFVDHRSRGYVSDGMVFAKWILGDGKTALENLAATQRRCTELLEENRILKANGAPL
jgi:hypothetical protein